MGKGTALVLYICSSLFTRTGKIDHRSVHRGHRKIRSEKVSTHSTQTPTELTRTRPQPFRLTSNSVHANNFLYSHPQSLDHIYLDCGGLVVNIQDGVSCTVISIKLLY